MTMSGTGCFILPLQGAGGGGDGPQGAALGWVRLARWAGMGRIEGIENLECRIEKFNSGIKVWKGREGRISDLRFQR